MSKQDMQFEKQQHRSSHTEERTQDEYQTRPINTDPREQPRKADPLSGYEPGYVGERQMQGEKLQPQARRHTTQQHKKSRWGRLLSITLVIIALIVGTNILFRALNIGTNTTTLDPRTFVVGENATLQIDNSAGNITVKQGSGNEVVITAKVESTLFGGEEPEINYQRTDSEMIQIDINDEGPNFLGSENVSFEITVPENMNLKLDSNFGNIEVEGINGQLELTSNTGNISVENATLTGTGKFETNTGNIEFEGEFGDNATYTLSTNTGNVETKLDPSDTITIDAHVNTGDINSEFSELAVQEDGPVERRARGTIGSDSNGANVTMETNTGSIDIERQ